MLQKWQNTDVCKCGHTGRLHYPTNPDDGDNRCTVWPCKKCKKCKSFMTETHTALAIKFGDNDFYNTFIPLLNTMRDSILRGCFTKKQIVDIINNCSYGFYLAFQNKFRYTNKGTKEYLQITEKNILLNEEVDKLFTTNDGWYNYEIFYVYANQEATCI